MLMAIVMAFLMCMGGVGSVGSILAGKWSGRLALRFCGLERIAVRMCILLV